MDKLPRRAPSALPIHHLRLDWFPIAVHPGRETVARLCLEDLGIVTVAPTTVRHRALSAYDRARRRKRPVTSMLIPGIILVGLDRPHPWSDVMKPEVVSHVISPDPQRPRPISRSAIGSLIRRRVRHRFVPVERQRVSGDLEPGDIARMTRGPMEGRRFRVEAVGDRTASLLGFAFGEGLGFDAPVDILTRDDE